MVLLGKRTVARTSRVQIPVATHIRRSIVAVSTTATTTARRRPLQPQLSSRAMVSRSSRPSRPPFMASCGRSRRSPTPATERRTKCSRPPPICPRASCHCSACDAASRATTTAATWTRRSSACSCCATSSIACSSWSCGPTLAPSRCCRSLPLPPVLRRRRSECRHSKSAGPSSSCFARRS